jgi:hypothetical protein
MTFEKERVMFRKKITLLSLILITVLSACNLPSGQTTETPTPDLALTLTALAGASPDTPAPQDTATPEFTATPELTVTPSVPTVSVSVNTNCRTGPGVIYQQIDALVVGQVAEVVGKNSGVPNYWVIKRINGSGTCWLWGEYATVTGNTANLPEYPVPPTPTPTYTPTPTATPTLASPAAVDNVAMNMTTCGGAAPYQHGGTLSWDDKSNNEDGFNIYINGALAASIPANSTSYNVAPFGSFAANSESIFEVEAFNGAGKAAKKSVSKGCP